MRCCALHFAGDGLFDRVGCNLKNTVGDTSSLQPHVLYRLISIYQYEFWPTIHCPLLSRAVFQSDCSLLGEWIASPLLCFLPAAGPPGYWAKREGMEKKQCNAWNVILISPFSMQTKVHVFNGYWGLMQLRTSSLCVQTVGERSN